MLSMFKYKEWWLGSTRWLSPLVLYWLIIMSNTDQQEVEDNLKINDNLITSVNTIDYQLG